MESISPNATTVLSWMKLFPSGVRVKNSEECYPCTLRLNNQVDGWMMVGAKCLTAGAGFTGKQRQEAGKIPMGWMRFGNSGMSSC